ncbi:MAG: poly-beta-hydroxybutyrate polymerase N-terminal domain-containing protein, partial [Chromatiaceae bacterium]
MVRKTRETRNTAPEALPARASAVCATDDPPTPVAQAARLADQAFKANLARLTAGISPAGMARVYFDWLSHLVLSPGKQVELAEKVARKIARFSRYASQKAVDNGTPPCIDPLPQDRRFADEAWQRWPYSFIYQAFLLNQQWWHNATTEIDGLAPDSERVVSFIARQMMDIWSPSNLPWLNPEVTQATLATGGMNLVKGWQNFVEDSERIA